MEKDKHKLTLVPNTGSELLNREGNIQAVATGDKVIEENDPHGYLSEEDKKRIKALVDKMDDGEGKE